MPLPPEKRTKFFVFVIESPSAQDLYHRRGEGDIIRNAVELNGIKCIVKTAISRVAFEACLKIGLAEEMKMLPGYVPLLHVSAHGNNEGIQLSDGYLMTWDELKSHLRPLNKALGGSLVICMSSCEGYSGIKMAMTTDDNELPYLALIGCGAMPTWGETAVGYATLYHQLWRGEHIADAVAAMRIASGNEMFFLEHASQSRRAYLNYISTVDTTNAQSELGKILANEKPEEQASLKVLHDAPPVAREN